MTAPRSRCAAQYPAAVMLEGGPKGRAGGPGDCPLTRLLRGWRRYVLPLNESPWVLPRLLAFVRGSTTGFVANLVWYALLLYELAAAESTRAAQSSLRLIMIVHPALFAIHLYRSRLRHLGACFADLLGAVEHLERFAHPKSKHRMARAALTVKLYTWFLIIYGTLNQLLLWRTFTVLTKRTQWIAGLAAVLHRAVAPDSVSPEDTAAVVQTLSVPVLWLAYLCLRTSFYNFLTFMMILLSSATVAYDAVARALEHSVCERHWAKQQAALLDAVLRINLAVADLMPNMMIATLGAPLLSALEVVLNASSADTYVVGMATAVVTMFVPLCLVGDNVVAAQTRVATLAYRGPWLEEPLAMQRLRLGMMTVSSSGRGAGLYGRGIGRFDRQLCGATLQRWFKFLQMLSSLQRVDG